jgi:pyrroline-5-carboxylate reductase
MCRNSDVLFIALRPNAVGVLDEIGRKNHEPHELHEPHKGRKPRLSHELHERFFWEGKTVISTVAGVTISRLEALCGAPVQRVMLSGPDSIRNGTALGAFFPDDQVSKDFLALLGVTAYPLRDEEDFHVFTAAMCLPSAYLQIELSGSQGLTDLIGAYTAALPFWDTLVAWSKHAVPGGFCKDEKLAYISAMATKGGVTEAIVGGIASGLPLKEAFERGVNRSREIAAANGA